MQIETFDGRKGSLTGARLQARKVRQLEDSERVIGGMMDELIAAKRNPNRWKTLPRREGVILRARQVELIGREDELLQSARYLAEWATEESGLAHGHGPRYKRAWSN